MKNILICLEKLDIGGVETSVINQALEYKRRGYKIVILAQNGIYTESLKKRGIIYYEYDFKLENKLFVEESKQIEEIIRKEKITEVHIHQYPCVVHILPILLKLGIPYVAFVHSIVDGTYEYFMNCYDTYKLVLPIFFQNASKIVVIRTSEIDKNRKLFNIADKSKYFLLKNSIDFKEITISKKYPKKITNFLLISRISEEKMISIKSGINYFLTLKEKNPHIKLRVLGDGKLLEKIKEEYNDESITYLGKSTEVYKYIQQSDVVIGVDRCILEAICNKKIAIISTYYGEVTLVDSTNIDALSKENFSGNNLTERLKREFNIDLINYEKNVTENYIYAEKKFNISNNILDEQLFIPNFNYWELIFKYSNLIISKLEKEQEESKRLFLENQELYRIINGSKIKTIINRIQNRIVKK